MNVCFHGRKRDSEDTGSGPLRNLKVEFLTGKRMKTAYQELRKSGKGDVFPRTSPFLMICAIVL